MYIGNSQSILTCCIWAFVLHYTQFKTVTKLIDRSLLMKWWITLPWELYNFFATCQKHRYTFLQFGVVTKLFPWKSMYIDNSQSILTYCIWTFVLHYTQFKIVTELIYRSLLMKWCITLQWELYNFSTTC